MRKSRTEYRHLDTNSSIWLNHDPIGERSGLNLYTYVRNDPIDLIDPLGLTDCAALATAIANQDNLIHGAISSMSDINQMFTDSRANSGYSIAESGGFALYSLAGIGLSLSENAAKNSFYAIPVSKGTIPVGVIGPIATGGEVVTAGSGIGLATVARDSGAISIGLQEGSQEVAQASGSEASHAVQQFFDPYGRLADVQNETGEQMSASTFRTILGLQSQLANMMDEYRQNCPCKK